MRLAHQPFPYVNNCLHMPKYPVCGYLLVSNQTVINSGPPGSAKLSLFISDFNMVFFTGGRKF